MEVVTSYPKVRLSTTTGFRQTAPKKPSIKAQVRVVTFFDVKQRIRLTFSGRKQNSNTVFCDTLVVSLQVDRRRKFEALVLKYHDYHEVRPSITGIGRCVGLDSYPNLRLCDLFVWLG